MWSDFQNEVNLSQLFTRYIDCTSAQIVQSYTKICFLISWIFGSQSSNSVEDENKDFCLLNYEVIHFNSQAIEIFQTSISSHFKSQQNEIFIQSEDDTFRPNPIWCILFSQILHPIRFAVAIPKI
jgi:hypothetical protein